MRHVEKVERRGTGALVLARPVKLDLVIRIGFWLPHPRRHSLQRANGNLSQRQVPAHDPMGESGPKNFERAVVEGLDTGGIALRRVDYDGEARNHQSSSVLQ